jgi:transcriptional antiterminator RfaH
MNNQKAGDVPSWYVVRTHAKQEDRAAGNLRTLGVQTLAPKIRGRRYNQYTSVPSYLTKPLFPSYIFARLKLDDVYHKIRFTRGVRALISFNGVPTPVDEDVIAMIQSRVREDGFIVIDEDLVPGDKVIIKAGPFRDFHGVFEREMKDADRVRLLLQTVSYQAHVEVERDLVAKFDESRSHA